MASDGTLRADASPATPYFGAGGRGETLHADRNEKVTLTEADAITAGDYTLTFGAQTTDAIAFNASIATIQTELEDLSSIGEGNVVVTGGPLASAPVVIEFVGVFRNTNVGAVTSTQTGLTGTFTITVSQAATLKSALIDTAAAAAEGRAAQTSSGKEVREVDNVIKVSANQHMITS